MFRLANTIRPFSMTASPWAELSTKARWISVHSSCWPFACSILANLARKERTSSFSVPSVCRYLLSRFFSVIYHLAFTWSLSDAICMLNWRRLNHRADRSHLNQCPSRIGNLDNTKDCHSRAVNSNPTDYQFRIP